MAGLLAGFFVVFNSVFSDVTDSGERLFTFALVIVVYLALGIAFGIAAISWQVGLVLAAPALLFVTWYTLREPGNLPLHLAYMALTLAASSVGAYIGTRIATRARPN
jgi:hypothetical protein